MAYSKVLFVDDDFWIHLANCEFLREHGLHIVEAYSAAEACALIDDGVYLTALVTDVDLGDSIDGFEIARRARAAYPHLPVVFISGAAAARHRTEGVLGSAFIAKPFLPHQVLEALDYGTYLQAA